MQWTGDSYTCMDRLGGAAERAHAKTEAGGVSQRQPHHWPRPPLHSHPPYNCLSSKRIPKSSHPMIPDSECVNRMTSSSGLNV